MTALRSYLDTKPKGEVARLAAVVGVTHAQISRIASGHRGASLSVAVALAKVTGLPPDAFARPTAVPTGHKGQRTAKAGKSSTPKPAKPAKPAKRANGRGRR